MKSLYDTLWLYLEGHTALSQSPEAVLYTAQQLLQTAEIVHVLKWDGIPAICVGTSANPPAWENESLYLYLEDDRDGDSPLELPWYYGHLGNNSHGRNNIYSSMHCLTDTSNPELQAKRTEMIQKLQLTPRKLEAWTISNVYNSLKKRDQLPDHIQSIMESLRPRADKAWSIRASEEER